MAKAKFEIIRDFENEIAGYKLGNHYLMKLYYLNNSYAWIINLDGKQMYLPGEFQKLYAAKKIYGVSSCKEGKEKLVELYNNAN